MSTRPLRVSPPKEAILAMTESQLQSEILKDARKLGWKHYHTRNSRRSPSGYPDLTLVHPRHGVVFAEIKTEKGVRSPAQIEWMDALIAAGARAYLWRPSSLDEARAVLKGEIRNVVVVPQ